MPMAIMPIIVFFVRGLVPTAIMLIIVLFFARELISAAIMSIVVFNFRRRLVLMAIMPVSETIISAVDIHRAYDCSADERANRPRSGYYAQDYRRNEQDAYRSSHGVDDYCPRSQDERRTDEMRQATRYNTSRGRADTADVSKWHIPHEVIIQYIHDKSIGELPDPEEVKARLHDQEYVQSQFNWRVQTDRLDAYWDANSVKLPLPFRSWLETNIDKQPMASEEPIQVLRDRILNTTQAKHETQTQRIEQALPGPAIADTLSDFDLFHSETFFMSRRRPHYGPSNLENMLSGVSGTQALEPGMAHETKDGNVESAPVPRRRRISLISDLAAFDTTNTTSQRPDEISSPNTPPSKKRRIDSPPKTE